MLAKSSISAATSKTDFAATAWHHSSDNPLSVTTINANGAANRTA